MGERCSACQHSKVGSSILSAFSGDWDDMLVCKLDGRSIGKKAADPSPPNWCPLPTVAAAVQGNVNG